MRQAIPFGKYLLLDRISVGGMAEVFRAKSYGVEGFEKVIAIKRILPSMGEDRDFIKMFIDEAKIAGQLAHANICQIFELGRTEGAHFIAMEFIWGKDLLQMQNRLRKLKQTMPPAMGCYVVAKVCEGLDYAHRRRDAMGRPLEIVHRDCSPQNVIVSYEGEVKVIDFGIAKAASRSSRTMHGVLKGKFGYMSPEQVRGLPLDRRSDIFALGTILYESLTGERLFQGDTDFAILEKVRNVEIIPPRQLNPALPVEVERIILKALARDVDQRYQWCSELLADLQAFLMGQPQVFTAKSLATWMKDGFGADLDKERAQIESYKKLGREGLIAGVPQAEARLDVVQHLGPAGQSEDPTVLGGPSFEDMERDNATQISSMRDMEQMAAIAAGPGNAVAPVAGEMAVREDQDFPEDGDGPTTIFGELGEAPQLPPTPGLYPPMATAQPAPPSVVVRSTAPMPTVPTPPRNPAGRATTQAPAAVPPPMRPGPMQPTPAQLGSSGPAPAAAKTLFGMAAPAAPPHFPAGTAPNAHQQQAHAPVAPPQAQVHAPPPQQQAYSYPPQQHYQQPGQASPGDPTVMGLNANQLPVADLVAQAQHQLAAYHAQQQPHGGHNADARTVMGMQAPQLPLQPGPPSGAMQPMPAVGYDYSQGNVQPAWPQHNQPLGVMPSFTPSGIMISPPTGDAVPAMATPEKRKRSSLGKDIAIGVGIAAAVLGLVAIIKFAVLGDSGGTSTAAAASAGTLVIAVADGDGAVVYVGDENRGVIEDGALTIEKVTAGPHEVRVEKSGAPPCTKQVDLEAGETEKVECSLAVAVAPPAPDAGVPAVTTDAGAVAATPDAGAIAVATPDAGAGSGTGSAAVVAVGPGSGSGSGSGTAAVSPGSGSGSSKKHRGSDDDDDDDDDKGSSKASGSSKSSGSGKASSSGKSSGSGKASGTGTGSSKKRGSGSGSGSGSGTGTGKGKVAAGGDGYLVAYTTPWAKVILDGKDTGKMTPIAPRAKIALSPGKHKVTFVVGKESWSYTVTIVAGETAKLSKDLPVTSP